MADREIRHHYVDDDGSGMGAMLGMIVGALLVLGGVFYFAGHFVDGDMSASVPAATETTGAR